MTNFRIRDHAPSFVITAKETMAFIIKKKRYKFSVDLTLNELTQIAFGKAILFAKVRQLDGGSFEQSSRREEVSNHAVKYDQKFSFPCKMAANYNTGVLDSCKCRVSIRKEEKGGKNFRKIGFVDLDLAEYAGAGPSTQRYILQAYDLHHRLDNSLLQITLNIVLKEGDLVFQRWVTLKACKYQQIMCLFQAAHAESANIIARRV